jgi:hypothetical protein
MGGLALSALVLGKAWRLTDKFPVAMLAAADWEVGAIMSKVAF